MVVTHTFTIGSRNEQFEIANSSSRLTNKVDIIGQTNSRGKNRLHYAAWFKEECSNA